MAKFVIAGKANCPYFARAEAVAEKLARNLPDFQVYKITKSANEWSEWLKNTCSQNNWKHTQSPIIWRELVDRGGRGMLLGDVNHFLEYTKGYYGVSTELTSEDLRKISSENEQTHNVIENERILEMKSIKPLVITITNPDSAILPFLLPEILNGSIFGDNEIAIRLFTSSHTENLNGLRMEIEDLAGAKLRYLNLCHTGKEAFKDCDYAILLDELKKTGESEVYANPYVSLAAQISEYAKKTCKILITPLESRSETYGLVNTFSKHLKNVNSTTNLIGNSMCEEMIAKCLLSHRLHVNPAFVKDVIMVGQSLQDTFYIDISKAKVSNFDGAVWARNGSHWLPLVNMVADKEWIHKDFIVSLHQRENLISEKLQRDGCYTFSQSVLKLLKLWNYKETDGCLYSAIVNVNGTYGINEDVFISVPVKFQNGSFEISDSYFQTSTLIAEISQDASKRIADRYKEGTYVKETGEKKLTIPNVVIE